MSNDPAPTAFQIEDIVGAIRRNRIRITDHADEEAQADRLSFDEVFTSVLHGEIIEGLPRGQPVSQLSSVRGHTQSRAGTQCMGVQRGD